MREWGKIASHGPSPESWYQARPFLRVEKAPRFLFCTAGLFQLGLTVLLAWHMWKGQQDSAVTADPLEARRAELSGVSECSWKETQPGGET